MNLLANVSKVFYQFHDSGPLPLATSWIYQTNFVNLFALLCFSYSQLLAFTFRIHCLIARKRRSIERAHHIKKFDTGACRVWEFSVFPRPYQRSLYILNMCVSLIERCVALMLWRCWEVSKDSMWVWSWPAWINHHFSSIHYISHFPLQSVRCIDVGKVLRSLQHLKLVTWYSSNLHKLWSLMCPMFMKYSAFPCKCMRDWCSEDIGNQKILGHIDSTMR